MQTRINLKVHTLLTLIALRWYRHVMSVLKWIIRPLLMWVILLYGTGPCFN